ncbi:MAG TPA: NAD/NADP octopine/nopaline dehydrogenase family protein [Candidatus Rubrimentiphilum sp.]|nr:NAD/NADP octopine/nopaline dehydrogenase family protein [Candidatus Rubrimentiphilum sp.]
MNVCICGNGSLAHALAVVFSAAGLEVTVLTPDAEAWRSTLLLYYKDCVLVGQGILASHDARTAVRSADIVICAVPASQRIELLSNIKPYLKSRAFVGSFPAAGGFFWTASAALGDRVLFGTDRVPYVRAAVDYGKSVEVTGIRRRLLLGTRPSSFSGHLSAVISGALNMPIDPDAGCMSVMLATTNPIAHPPRVYSLFNGAAQDYVYPEVPRFLADWDTEASHMLLSLDDELSALSRSLPADTSSLRHVLQHFEVTCCAELTERMRNIVAQDHVYAPLIKNRDDTGYVADLQSPYFVEDFEYGLTVLRSLAELVGVETPTMDRLLTWYERFTGRRLLKHGTLRNEFTAGLPLPWNCGINDATDLGRFCNA